MADDYTVELQGHVFSVAAPRVRWLAEAEMRTDQVPSVQSVLAYTLTLEGCRVRTTDGTPGTAATALGTFLANTISKRTLPTYLKILDSGSQPISEIGQIQPGTNDWEELHLVAFELPPGEEQLVAGAEFSLRFTARKVFGQSENAGLVHLRREYSSRFGADWLEVRTLRTSVVMKAGTAVPLTADWLLTLARVSAPAGWVRVQGGSAGFDVSYPLYGRTDRAELVSEVQQLGGGVVAPTNAGPSTYGETRTRDPETGLLVVRTFAETVGSEDGLDWVDALRPAGAVGSSTHDKGKRAQRGEWEHLEADRTVIGGKVYRINVLARQLDPGGRVPRTKRVSGNFLPITRKGAVKEWRFSETLEVLALGVVELGDVPTPPHLPEPWVYDPEQSDPGAPRIHRRSDEDVSRHLWRREVRRSYVWTGEKPPLEDEEFTSYLVRTFSPGEEGLVLE